MKKVDKNGVYSRFPGVTIISFLSKENKTAFEEFRNWVVTEMTIFTKYYSMLPVSSYHATLKNHTVLGRNNEISYLEKIITNFQLYEKIKKVCSDFPFEFHCATALAGPYFQGTFGISLEFQQHNHVEKLREDIVALGSLQEPGFKFHMTLAYQYKQMEQEDFNVFSFQISEISKKLKNLVFALQFTLTFEKPQLCYFKDMTCFEPM